MEALFTFLEALKVNNDREWFKANEAEYKSTKVRFEAFVEALARRLSEVDDSIVPGPAKNYVFRIFKDVRFSKDKSPYKTHFSAFISEGGRKSPYAGYYVHLEPGASFLGGGIYAPESSLLRVLREEVVDQYAEFRGLLEQPKFKALFGGLSGERLTNVPRGFSKDHEAAELIKHKHFVVTHPTTNGFWCEEDVLERTVQVFQAQYPLNAWLNRVVKGLEEQR